jgi:hypothetical protein
LRASLGRIESKATRAASAIEQSRARGLRGRLIGYNFDGMVVLFSMMDGQKEILCAISTSATDTLASAAPSRPNQREAQFMRLRDQIEERAARKSLAMEFERNPPADNRRSAMERHHLSIAFSAGGIGKPPREETEDVAERARGRRRASERHEHICGIVAWS